MRPNWDYQQKRLQRFSWSWSRCVYTLGISYFDAWNYRYGDSRDISKPDQVIRCIELGLFWWDIKFFWLANIERAWWRRQP